MPDNKITCPKCGHKIPLDQALLERLNAQVKNQLEAQVDEERKQWQKEAAQKQTAAINQIQQKLEDARQKELNSIKKQYDLEDKIKSIELENARKNFEEKKIIEDKAQKDAATKYELLLAEERKRNEDTQKRLRELEQKSRQGSMQTQGEVLELSLEELLKQTFPSDKIEPVPKGITGADIIQTVYSQTGQRAGMIIWESKRTKNWTEEWVQKLKDDSRNIKANFSVLVSQILPKDINHVGQYQGIWVCDFPSCIGLATALRSHLQAVTNAVVTSSGKDEKKEALYQYLTSDTFSQRVQALVETFMNMRNNLEKEKIAFNKIWASRETHIMRLTENTAKMYGEIQGIAGSALPEIELMELEEPKNPHPQEDKQKPKETTNQLF